MCCSHEVMGRYVMSSMLTITTLYVYTTQYWLDVSASVCAMFPLLEPEFALAAFTDDLSTHVRVAYNAWHKDTNRNKGLDTMKRRGSPP